MSHAHRLRLATLLGEPLPVQSQITHDPSHEKTGERLSHLWQLLDEMYAVGGNGSYCRHLILELYLLEMMVFARWMVENLDYLVEYF